MTDAERALWQRLRAHRLDGLSFRRQVPIGPFIVDFVCPDHALIVEVDGGQHADAERDAERDRWLMSKGYRVLRFWNHEVLRNRDGVLETILNSAREVLPEENDGATLATSPLEGEVDAAQQRREGGKSQASVVACTPLPNPPPQGGREQVIPEPKQSDCSGTRP